MTDIISGKTFFTIALVSVCTAQLCAAYTCGSPGTNTSRTRNFFHGRRWPNNTVRYELHSSLASEDIDEVYTAINDIQTKTCIRFAPRNGEQGYTSIERDDSQCGWAHYCYTGGRQIAKFGGNCRNMNLIVHELSHNLCLTHEHTRSDRDEYLYFADHCSFSQRRPIEDYDTKGYLYDYTSVMHYYCGWCDSGWPRKNEVTQCGPDKRPGLSVLDADKLNDFYDCQGCLGHRWKRIESLPNEDKENLFPFGATLDSVPMYICRAYMGNEIATGKYRADTGWCMIAYGGREHNVSTNAQVLTIPRGANRHLYTATHIDQLHQNPSRKPVPAGRKGNGIEGYVAVAEVEHDGRVGLEIGKAWSDEMWRAFIPFGGRELYVTDFYLLTCG